MMATTKAQIRATNKYMAKAYDSLRIVVPKGRKLTVETYAREHGQSVNGLVNELLAAAIGIEKDSWKLPMSEGREAE